MSHAAPPTEILDRVCRHLARTRGYAALALPEALRTPGAPEAGADGGAVAQVPELVPLAAHFERILVRTDGYGFEVLCLKDRTAGAPPLELGLEALLEVARSCLRYTGQVNGTKLPVTLAVQELSAGGPLAVEHLRPLRKQPWRGKVSLSASAVRLDTGEAWTNAPLGGLGAAKRLGRLVRRLAEEDEGAPAPAAELRGVPVVTISLLGVLASCFALQLVLGPWAGLLSPTLQALVAEGGLARGLVAQGQWYRLVSAAFLHGDLLHLLFNGLALALGGAILEQLVGRWWFLVVYGLSLLGGSLASLAFNAPEVISVGASGAIMGVLAAAFVATARLRCCSDSIVFPY
ncbi:MAG: rhomboid family intramembrane serine protease [Anaeromyxobacter sp.]